MRTKNPIWILASLILAWIIPVQAQWQTNESVLNQHTWYKIGVTEDGVYAIDYATFRSMGIDVESLNPNRIRIFGNAPGMLPEENSKGRFDDLTEIPIEVTGEDDGKFNEADQVRFYGNGPVQMSLSQMNMQPYYSYTRNSYTDTIFYFMCVDSDVDGLRIQDNRKLLPDQVASRDTPIKTYLDYLYHESEELSPYASGRIWYGDRITTNEGSKEFVFKLPGLDSSKLMHAESRVLGRCNSPFRYSMNVNATNIINNSIKKIGNLEYGKEDNVTKQFRTTGDSLAVRYELDSTSATPVLYIDRFVINFWRELRYRSPEMAFRIVPSQLVDSVSRIQLTGVGADVECWDVTDPIVPCRQPLAYESGNASFCMAKDSERRFHLFEPSGLKQIASSRRIPNQNLHAITDAEMLIITPRVFWNQSEELADFHLEQDSMKCVVADVQEIFNEFGTGVGDPTAIRDFIRMVYLRSEGHLKYVLLMGKGSHDYRDIKGMHNNFVPTYEIAEKAHREVESMCSDDYYALMDLNEGKDCVGKVDLGMGRIPITIPEQGDAVVAKIKHYADLAACHGIWKNNHLFMADNDNKTYPDHADDLDYILDTSWRVAMTKKLYLGSYQKIETPSGDRLPEANAALMDYFDKGVSVISYTGHGGVTSLSAEWVLGVSDIPTLNNFDRLPFIHTATCEFSKFDDPGIVSGGELMLLRAQGGAIALLTTMRPTTAPNNLSMSKSLHDHMYERIDNRPMRFGDIYRVAKSDPKYYKKDNIVYILYGDPALRFSYPSQLIHTEKVNGVSVADGGTGTVSTEKGTIEGFVAGVDTEIDTAFNGVVDVIVYDVKSYYTGSYKSNDHTYYYRYSYYHDIIFEGKATVENGRFGIDFPVPAEISQSSGACRVSYYAYDSIRNVDANGVFDQLIVESPEVVDNQGPEIHFYWNSPDFENGDTVVRRGVLYADLFDEHGIYHYNVSIGRDIVLKSNLTDYDNMILNDWYEPALDDWQRGRIALPVKDLEDGSYEFRLKAWDTQNNSTEVEISFEVRQGAILAQVRNFPNPFTTETWISFDHGDMTDRLSVVVEVFDMMGRQVDRIEETTHAEIGVVTPIRWDGSRLSPGIYVYRVTVTNSQGKTSTMSQRMVKQ